MTNSVFIYNGHGASSHSSDDLKELFIRHGHEIYNSRPDVSFYDSSFKFDGNKPDDMTLVFPGGSTGVMGSILFEYKDNIQKLFDVNCNTGKSCKGVFVCAGAYLATNNADLFTDTYTMDAEADQFHPLQYDSSTFGYYLNPKMDIIPDYKAFGPFIPNNSYVTYYRNNAAKSLHASVVKSYCVDLLMQASQKPVKQLYLSGCGFEHNPESKTNTCEVVAIYHDQNRYSFFYHPGNTKTISNMPAIIRKPGVILSGTHIETCVEDSKLLKLMQDGVDNRLLPLAEGNQYNPVDSRDTIIPLLKETLNPGI